MKGSSFGVIYDAFDGFERQMEDSLDGIFNEDVPPGVTAVAASVTQFFQSIIGCNNTCIINRQKLLKPEAEKWCLKKKNRQKLLKPEAEKWHLDCNYIESCRRIVTELRTLWACCVSCASLCAAHTARTAHHTLVLNVEP